MGPSRMRLNKVQKPAVAALEDIKARNITVLDVRKLTSLYDTMIIATAESNRQVRALAQHVREALKAAGATIVGVEGEQAGGRGVGGGGGTGGRIKQPPARTDYKLEGVW